MDELNRAGLRAKLGAGYTDDRYTLPHGGEAGDILVKTEKGSEWQKQEPAAMAPDWNQSDSSARDYIKNRPGGYYEVFPAVLIQWDGTIGDKVVVDIPDFARFVKVSDAQLDADRLAQATMVDIFDGDEYTDVLDSSYIEEADQGIVVIVGSAPYVVVTKQANAEINGVQFPEVGVYFYYSSDNFRTISLYAPESRVFTPIPAEYTSIAGGYDIQEKTVEIFAGRLTAGSFHELGGGDK